MAWCRRARPRVSTHIAGTTHKAGAAWPGGAAGPEDDADAEDDEAGPSGEATGGSEEGLEEAEPVDKETGGDEAGPVVTAGASGMSGDRPAATRARATSTPEATLAYHSAVRVFLKSGPKARHSGSLM